MKTITSGDIKAAVPGVDAVGKNKAKNFVARREFFYKFGKTAEDLVARIKQYYPAANIIASGEHWTGFSGGASTSKSSHWWVEFNFDAPTLF
jgi:hypothetical protein